MRAPPLVIKGGASFSGGPDILDSFEVACFNNVGVEINVDSSFKAMGGAGLFYSEIFDFAEDGVIEGTLEGGLDWRSSTFTLKGELNFQWRLFTDKGDLSIAPGEFSGTVLGTLRVPEGLPFLGGKEIAGVTGTINKKGMGGEHKVGPLSVAYFIEWQIAKVRNPLDAVPYIHVGTNLKKIGFLPSKRFYVLGMDIGTLGVSTFEVPAALDKVLIRLVWETGDTDFNLITPEGTEITPDYAAGHPDEVIYMKGHGEAWYGIKNPSPGIWQVEVFNSEGIGAYTVSVYSLNSPPQIEITEPSTKVTADGSITIGYTARDADDTAKISLYNDTDREGGNGVLIVDNLLENDTTGGYTWDVSGVPSGIYYIYAVIDDGKNAPVFTYSTGAVEVVHSDAPPTPTGFSGTVSGTTVSLRWDSMPNVTGYKIYYTDDPTHFTYKNSLPLSNAFTSYQLGELRPETAYRFAISSFDFQGRESPMSAPLVLSTETASVPSLKISPETIDLGAVKLGDSALRTVQIENTGEADLTIAEMALYGSGVEFLSIEAQAYPLILAPGTSAEIPMSLRMLLPKSVNCSLTIRSNDPNSPTKMIPVKGAVLAQDISVRPALLNFGNLLVGSTSSRLTVSVTNQGGNYLNIGGLTIAGANPSEFHLSDDTCSGARLLPDQSCEFGVSFTPISLGLRSGEIRVPSDDSDENIVIVSVSGTGVQPDITVSPTEVDFGKVLKGGGFGGDDNGS